MWGGPAGLVEVARGLPTALNDLWRDITFGNWVRQPRTAGLGWLLLPLLLIGLIDLWLHPRLRVQENRADGPAWGWLFISALLIPLLFSLLRPKSLPTSSILYVAPVLYLLVALGIVRLWQTIRLLGVTAALMAGMVAFVGLAYYQGAYASSDYRAMAREVQSNLLDGSGAVVLAAPGQQPLARYYLTGAALHTIPQTSLTTFWPVQAEPLVPEVVDGQIKDILAAEPRLWLVLSNADEVDPGEFLPKYLTAVAFKEDCDRWVDVELCRYTSPDFVTPLHAAESQLVYNDELVLTGTAIGLTPPRTEEEEYLLARLDWTTQSRPTLDYKLTLRLLDPAGQVVEQSDDFPIGPLLPPTTWIEQDNKVSFKTVEIPDDAAPGLYSLRLGVYDPNTGELVAHRSANGEPSTEMIELAILQIGDDGATLTLTSPGGEPSTGR
ncbi:MAG: hypothetical protein HC802_18550 [Caldilineaceae bacterium]|nr:hypothetical protein [Caldilineaceae bacterium]